VSFQVIMSNRGENLLNQRLDFKPDATTARVSNRRL
jgi:hypothetical protein